MAQDFWRRLLKSWKWIKPYLRLRSVQQVPRSPSRAKQGKLTTARTTYVVFCRGAPLRGMAAGTTSALFHATTEPRGTRLVHYPRQTALKGTFTTPGTTRSPNRYSPPTSVGHGSHNWSNNPIHQTGWSNSTCLSRMDSIHQRPMGFEGGSRVQPRVAANALPVDYSPTYSDECNGGEVSTGRSEQDVRKRSHTGSGTVQGPVSKQIIPGSKKRWILPTSGQSKALEQVHKICPLQNGGVSHGKGPPESERLDDNAQSEGYLLLGPHSPTGSEVPSFPMATKIIRIPMSTIRIEQHSASVHKTAKTNFGVDEAKGDSSNCLSGRLPNTRINIPGSLSPCCNVKPCSSYPWFYSEPGEIQPNTNRENPVLGVLDQFEISDNLAANRESQPVEGGSKSSVSEEKSDGKGVVKVVGQNNSNSASCATSTLTLPSSTVSEELCMEEGPILRDNDHSGSTSSSRVEMVDDGVGLLERQICFTGQTSNSLGNRCLLAGLGSSLHERVHWGSMVRAGKVSVPHQRLGAICRVVSSESPCQKSHEHPHSPTDGQYYSDCLHKQDGRHKITLSSQLTNNLWSWALGRGITLSAEHLPGIQNVIADRESCSMRSTAEWEILDTVLQKVFNQMGNCKVDLFADRLNHKLPQYVSWRPDPYAMATDAFRIGWTEVQGYAFPPFYIIGRCLRKIIEEEAQILMILPVWPSQPWFPTLSLAICPPLFLPKRVDLLVNPLGEYHAMCLQGTLQLVIIISNY